MFSLPSLIRIAFRDKFLIVLTLLTRNNDSTLNRNQQLDQYDHKTKTKKIYCCCPLLLDYCIRDYSRHVVSSLCNLVVLIYQGGGASDDNEDDDDDEEDSSPKQPVQKTESDLFDDDSDDGGLFSNEPPPTDQSTKLFFCVFVIRISLDSEKAV